ncbi:MAG: N-6 DNA methylase [Balneolaceae bacterium]|nr:N-6 DNA methylase [Balneolaceae bacterium]
MVKFWIQLADRAVCLCRVPSFRERHRQNSGDVLSIYGQEKVENTVRLCKMNLAVHGLEGDIRSGNSYYENIHDVVAQVRLCDGQSAV